MVLTEAFAAGTPVVASDIAGYRDVVANGVDGLLVPRGDATALGGDPARPRPGPGARRAPGRRRPRSAERYAWPRVAEQVVAAYEDARAVPRPRARSRAPPCGWACCPPTGKPRVPPRRLPSLEPAPACARRALRVARCPLGGAPRRPWSASFLAVQHIGPGGSATRWCARARLGAVRAGADVRPMLLRAVSWHAILKAALPDARPRMVDAVQGTTIGVLMSATLPARLGEPSRALVVARRLGRARDRLPVVLGTLVSQTLLNVVALVILGAAMFRPIGLFAGRQQALLWYGLAPIALLCLCSSRRP